MSLIGIRYILYIYVDCRCYTMFTDEGAFRRQPGTSEQNRDKSDKNVKHPGQ